MKSLTHAIVGVTSGVAAFVVLDLMRHHGVELPRIDWERPVLASTAVSEPGGAVEDASARETPLAMPASIESSPEAIGAVAAARHETRDEAGEASVEVPVDPAASTTGSLAAANPRSQPATLPTAAAAPTPNPPAAAASDLARAGERAKALAAAMERLGKRLDGTSHRGFPR